MSLQRVVLISRRFWPLVGGAEMVMALLAAGLKKKGLEVTLLTAQWQADWPKHFEHHSVPVIRLPQPNMRMWGTWCYMRAVRRWLKENRNRFDLAYVSMLKHDACATIDAGRNGNFPVLLRAEGAGLTGDCHWQIEARFGRWIKNRCRRAAAVVAPSRAIQEELIAAGYPRPRIHYLPNGVPLPPARSESARQVARQSLAEVRPDLAISADTPLVVFTGRIAERKGLEDLLAAWAIVTQKFPQARLWLVGEGNLLPELIRQVRKRELSDRVAMAGAFDDVGDILSAADLFVLPSLEEGMSLSLLEAMAQGLPVVATDIPGNRTLVEDRVHGRLVPTESPERLAQAIEEVFSNPSAASRWGESARQRVHEEFSLDTMVEQHLELFRQLLESRP